MEEVRCLSETGGGDSDGGGQRMCQPQRLRSRHKAEVAKDHGITFGWIMEAVGIPPGVLFLAHSWFFIPLPGGMIL